jgi:hypothetical protein
VLPRFEIVARHRPVALVGQRDAFPLIAPFAALEADLTSPDDPAELALEAADGCRLTVRLGGGRVSLAVVAGGREHVVRSRRHGRVRDADRLGLTLTGRHLSVLTYADDAWTLRGRVDLADLPGTPDPTDTGWLASVRPDATGAVAGVIAGGFGQLGLRDVRVVSHADGSPYREGDEVLLTATSAGPGFFGTAHTSVWALGADNAVTHRADLFFGRPDRPGVHGDHATHLLRDGGRWLVATSTWSDFPADRSKRAGSRVSITLAESDADLTRGRHLLPTRALELPTDGPSVGVWDPHLARDDDGSWLVGYVSARKFFDFHPVLATGPTLEALTLRAAAGDRTATEGTTLARLGGTWRVLASDGRDNPKAVAARFPVLDLDLRELGTVDAPYPTNIPWPTLVAPDPAVAGDRWRLVTFNGRPSGGALAGYGTHGDLVVLQETR